MPSTLHREAATTKKLLIVDDSAVILRTLSIKLRSGGYQVLTAADGSEAVSTVRKEKPDLILLDINFPPDVAHGGGVAWDGFLILNWLRRMDEAVNTPVVIITGTDSEKNKQRCLAAGVAGYFQKPINSDELLAEVGKILSSKTNSGSNAAEKARKVLFIDDEDDWRFMAGVYLKDSGFEVLAASNGPEALAKMRETKPQVVLLDINLGTESGLEILKQIKAEHPGTRVVLYTGMDHDAATVQAMLRLGAAGYLRKSTMGEMLKAVERAFTGDTLARN